MENSLRNCGTNTLKKLIFFKMNTPKNMTTMTQMITVGSLYRAKGEKTGYGYTTIRLRVVFINPGEIIMVTKSSVVDNGFYARYIIDFLHEEKVLHYPDVTLNRWNQWFEKIDDDDDEL